ncbi:MAG: hypothetical protein LAO07_01020 [Acidobacteriia bacterium]|nr:hypothetical protein [Terriglobia bacterium]
MTLIYGLLLALFAGPSAAQVGSDQPTGIVQGKIQAPSTDEFIDDILRARAANRYISDEAHRKHVKQYTLSEKAVVYLETIGTPPSYDPPESHPRLDQQDMLFRPIVLPVLVGTTVDFPNNDDLFHNVFSYSEPKEFDLGRYPQGQKKSVTFDKPGVVKVYCDIHSYMYATILVLENPYFAVPDEEGNYRITHVAPGKYRACFWYGRKLVETRMVTIAGSETHVENFAP